MLRPRRWILWTVLVAGCSRAPSRTAGVADSTAHPREAVPAGADGASAPTVLPAGTDPAPSRPATPSGQAPPPTLSPLADTIASYLVFAPVGEQWFVTAVRNKKLLMDIGRVDAEVRRDSSRATAYREAVARHSIVPLGTTVTLRTVVGAEEVRATAVSTWNSRIVLVLEGSAALDSLVRATPALVALAHVRLAEGVVASNVLSRPPGSLPAPAVGGGRAGGAVPATGSRPATSASGAASAVDSCDRTAPLPAELTPRLTVLRDSLEHAIRTGTLSPYERLRKGMSTRVSQVRGCFGGARRLAMLVSVRAGDVEWSRERLVLVDTLGKATSLRISDYRFRAHELLVAFDANGDAVDDVAVRSTTQRAGGTSVLAVDVKGRRATRLSVGFVWEDF